MNSIDEIEKVRARNNKNWMMILKLAFKLAPKKARIIMNDIADCDSKINELFKKLAK